LKDQWKFFPKDNKVIERLEDLIYVFTRPLSCGSENRLGREVQIPL
jgi:hypothetical protein